MTRAAAVRLGLALLISTAFLAWIAHQVGWQRLWQPWAALSPAALALALALLVLSYLLRALRLYDYFHGEMAGRFARCLRLTLIHNLLNNLLPMRSGELSFPVLMSRYFQVPALRALPALLWFRLLDLHTLAVLGGAAVLLLWQAPLWGWLLWLLWLPLPWLAFRLATALAPRLQDERGWRRLAHRALTALPTSPRALWRSWAWTGVNWGVKLAVFAWFLSQFAPLSFSAALLGAIGGELSSVLPVHGVAGIGTYEAGVAAALAPLRMPLETTLSAALNLHLLLLGATLLGGALAPLLGRRP